MVLARYKHVDPVKERKRKNPTGEQHTDIAGLMQSKGWIGSSMLRQRAKNNAMKELGIFEMMQSEKKKETADVDDDEDNE